MAMISDAVLAELAGPVAAAMPALLAHIPTDPAAQLGRVAAPQDDAGPTRQRSGSPGLARRPAAQLGHVAAPQDDAGPTRQRPESPLLGGAGPTRQRPESPLPDALRSVGPLLAERLLGALELAVRTIDLSGAPDLSAHLDPPPSGAFGFAFSAQESEAIIAVTKLSKMWPDAAELIITLTARLATRPAVAAQLAVPASATDEESIAAAHGAAHLALAVATAIAVLPAGQPADVIGTGIGASVLLLRETPMPAGYADALLAQARASFRLPRRVTGSAPVSAHRFGLVEDAMPDTVDFSGNGLVAVVPGGVVIRTGVATGDVRVRLNVTADAPASIEPGWDEIVEVSWHATTGWASIMGPDGHLRRATHPWPGDYRLRVHARGRDADDDEDYLLEVWPAPAAPEIAHRRTDRLGHRLRGEPEPSTPDRPELAYRWLHGSALDMAATCTVVTGAAIDEVVRAFGGDPDRPESLAEITLDGVGDGQTDPWITVLGTGDAVIVVEHNGWRGTDADVLRRVSAHGRAASMYWNVNAMTRLSFAEHGELLASFEPFGDFGAGPALAPVLDGLDFADYRDKRGKGMVAVERFTGWGVRADDIARIRAADVAFRIE